MVSQVDQPGILLAILAKDTWSSSWLVLGTVILSLAFGHVQLYVLERRPTLYLMGSVATNVTITGLLGVSFLFFGEVAGGKTVGTMHLYVQLATVSVLFTILKWVGLVVLLGIAAMVMKMVQNRKYLRIGIKLIQLVCRSISRMRGLALLPTALVLFLTLLTIWSVWVFLNLFQTTIEARQEKSGIVMDLHGFMEVVFIVV